MDPLKGAIALRKYIQERNDAGFVEQPAVKPSSADSALPNIDAWVRAFHDSDEDRQA